MSDYVLPEGLPDWIKKHTRAYLDNGDSAHSWDAAPGGYDGEFDTLLLFTTGRKSGKTFVSPVIYQATDEGGYCIVASKGGAPQHPAWFLNLKASPATEIQVRSERIPVRARITEGEEREKLWQIMANYYPGYEAYQKRSPRQIPVVILEPTSL